MNRLYQWFRAGATWFISERRHGHVTRTVRTQVTLQQEQRLWLIRDSGRVRAETCPVCGHAMEGGAIAASCGHNEAKQRAAGLDSGQDLNGQENDQRKKNG